MAIPISTSRHSFIVQTSEEAAINMPLGKPNPESPCISFENDMRDRVEQSAQKIGRCCWYYAFNMVRRRVGRIYKKEFQAGREVEGRISFYRKNMTQSHIFHDICLSLGNSIGHETSSIHLFVQNIRKDPSVLRKALDSAGMTFDEKIFPSWQKMIVPFFEKFISQKSPITFKEFCAEEEANDAIFEAKELLAFFTTTPENEYKKYREAVPSLPAWDDLSIDRKRFVLHQIVSRVAYQKYGLAESTWKPSQSMSDLLKEISTRGPLVVFGSFGQTYYDKPADLLTATLGKHRLYGWKGGRKKDTSQLESHVVTLIGGNINSKNDEESWLYFYDPRYGSNPAKPEERKIFVMSLRRLRTDISNLWAEKMWDDEKRPVFSKTINYAIYRP